MKAFWNTYPSELSAKLRRPFGFKRNRQLTSKELDDLIKKQGLEDYCQELREKTYKRLQGTA